MGPTRAKFGKRSFAERSLVALSLAILVIFASTTTVSAVTKLRTQQSATAQECTEVKVPVTLDVVLNATVHATLCLPAKPVDTIQLLLHGGTYNASYWDFPHDPERFSYVRKANEAGYATLAIDRVGYGQSTRVPSATLTGLSHSNTVHQIVGKLKKGQIGDHVFRNVVLVGHSMGSGIAVMEAATYKDVEGVVLTGMAHRMSVNSLVGTPTFVLRSVALDPTYWGRGYDPGYFTSVPGKRTFFYAPGDADEDVVRIDENTKDVLSIVESADIISVGFLSPLSLKIDVPVLVAVGEQDAIFCRGVLASSCSDADALKKQESAYFSAEACLSTFVLDGSGHNVNLSVRSGEFFRAVHDWTDTYVGKETVPNWQSNGGCRNV